MSDELLRELIAVQKAQSDLLRKYLWRVRFSMFGLMLLMTLIGVALGMGVYMTRPKQRPIIVAPPTVMPVPNSPYQNYQTPPNQPQPGPIG